VHPVQLENIGIADYLKPYRVLFLTYEGMKPPAPELHQRLARWVRSGGVLVVVDDDSDPYNAVREWWNTGAFAHATPRHHLFTQLELKTDTAPGEWNCGQGHMIYRALSPASLTKGPQGAETALQLAQAACEKAKLTWQPTDYLLLHRGPYIVAAGLDESPAHSAKTINGLFINLFDPLLKVSSKLTLIPGARHLLFDVSTVDPNRPQVLASAAKVLGFQTDPHQVRFVAAGPEQTMAVTRIALPTAPKSVQIGGQTLSEAKQIWDPISKTVLIQYPNIPTGSSVDIVY
jgi:hypothetical protein